MISAAAAETHIFARVKRNGYDPYEVDAVVARLIDDLHQAEARIDELTQQAQTPRHSVAPRVAITRSPDKVALVGALS